MLEELLIRKQELIDELESLDEQIVEESEEMCLNECEQPIIYAKYEDVGIVISECDCCGELNLTLIDDELNKIQVPLGLVMQMVDELYGEEE